MVFALPGPAVACGSHAAADATVGRALDARGHCAASRSALGPAESASSARSAIACVPRDGDRIEIYRPLQ